VEGLFLAGGQNPSVLMIDMQKREVTVENALKQYKLEVKIMIKIMHTLRDSKLLYTVYNKPMYVTLCR
jgi:hypothetical protein